MTAPEIAKTERRYFHWTGNNLHQYPKFKLPTQCAKCSFPEKSSAWIT